MPLDVSVVVPARDASATIERLLAALASQSPVPPAEVIVVDDGSRDDTAELAGRADLPVRVLRQPPEGPGPARNRGAAEARGELIAFTDADCFPTPGWLAAGAAAAERADLVQGAVLPDPAVRMGPFDRSLWVTRESGLYETASLFVRRPLFEELGGFQTLLEPEMGKALAEDVWLGWRARRSGARTAFRAEALVHHAVIPRGALEYVAERRRLVHFPQLAAHVPELRESLFFRRLFLSSRTAAFDAALAGLAAAARTRSLAPALAAAPYAWTIARRSLESGPRAPLVAPVEAAADAVGLAALVRGSLKARAAVL